MIRFFTYFSNRDLKQLTEEEIEGYVYHPKSKYKISDSMQNTVINTQENMQSLKLIFKSGYDIKEVEPVQTMPRVALTEVAEIELTKYEEKLILKAYSQPFR